MNAAYERGFFSELGIEPELELELPRLRITRRAYRDQFLAGVRAADRCSSSLSSAHE